MTNTFKSLIMGFFLTLTTSPLIGSESSQSEIDRLMAQTTVEYYQNLFIIVSGDNCSFCKKEHALISTSRSVQLGLESKYANFFELNQDSMNIPESLRVPVTPAIFIIDKNHDIIYTEYGFKNEVDLLDLIDEFGIEVDPEEI